MRLAVLGDVHGNAFALRAVLNDIAAASPDEVLNLGDAVWGAADPATAWALQQEHAPPSVRGNTDERVAGLKDGKAALRDWLLPLLPEDAARTLGALPTTLDTAGGEVRLAHGSPRSPWEDLLLTRDDGRSRPATRPEIRERLGDFAGRVVVVGHTHWEMLSVVDGVTVVNAGPVSRQKDGLPHARWVLLTRQAGVWNAEFRRTPYDTAAAAAWARTHGPGELGEREGAQLLSGKEA